MLIWIKDVPKFRVNPDAHVIHYVDSIITCGKPTDDRQELKELLVQSPMYIVSYVSKAQRGISDLLRTACEEAKLGNSTVQQQVSLFL